ncbi:hypothetical protein ACFVUH_18770 [Kitasatospora sp. NPDC058032]|uniref:hypothetical protein n=1 Tax=Kitasatospora sp. NPDC058032 TaxID=3346307 RepID=UPI0036D9A8EC
MAAVLAVTATFVAHNVLYTYVAALLAPLGLDGRTDTVLLVIGVSSLVSILGTGALIDRCLRPLTVAASVVLAAALAVTLGGRRHAFPGRGGTRSCERSCR